MCVFVSALVVLFIDDALSSMAAAGRARPKISMRRIRQVPVPCRAQIKGNENDIIYSLNRQWAMGHDIHNRFNKIAMHYQTDSAEKDQKNFFFFEIVYFHLLLFTVQKINYRSQHILIEMEEKKIMVMVAWQNK